MTILDECWEWKGSKTSPGRDGYGLKMINGKRRTTHRIAYEWAYGPDHLQLVILRVLRDEKAIAELEAEAAKFLDELAEMIGKLSKAA